MPNLMKINLGVRNVRELEQILEFTKRVSHVVVEYSIAKTSDKVTSTTSKLVDFWNHSTDNPPANNDCVLM